MDEVSYNVAFDFPALHQWSDAPPQVHYLRNLHRHLFHVNVQLLFPVDGDRQIEFLMLQDQVKLLALSYVNVVMDIHSGLPVIGSCEALAKHIVTTLREEYPTATGLRAEVVEDEGPGAAIIWTPECEA